MAMIFIENFYGTTDLCVSRGWEFDNTYSLEASGTNNGAYTRNAQGGALYLSGGTGIRRFFGGTANTIILGFALGYESASSSAFAKRILRLCEGSITHISFGLDANNYMAVWRGDMGTVLATTSITPRLGSSNVYYYYVEIETTISNAAGVVKLWVNGNLIVNLSGIDTNNGGTGYIDNLYFAGVSSAGLALITDVYCLDTTGAVNNARIGDCRVDTLLPNGNDSVAWSRSAGASNFALVDDTTMDFDSTYVYSSTIGQQDIYDFTALPSAGNLDVKATSTFLIVRNEFPGTNTVRPLTKISGFVYNGPSFSLTPDVQYLNTTAIHLQETSPATGVAWTKAELSAAQFGIEKV